MEVVKVDKRGRLTLPVEARRRADSDRFLVVPERDSVRLIPLPEPGEVRGSVEIPWSIEELEEAGEGFVRDRAGG